MNYMLVIRVKKKDLRYYESSCREMCGNFVDIINIDVNSLFIVNKFVPN